MRATFRWIAAAAFVASLTACGSLPEPVEYDPVAPDYWPTSGWQRSTPEAQGMDSAVLAEMVDYYHKEQGDDLTLLIDSITIIRNGYMVADIYLNPLIPEDTPHIINSCAKSFVSALIGIAIDEGYIEGVDQPVVEILRPTGPIDELKAAITIRDLLTMQTGLRSRDSYLYGWVGLDDMEKSDDWVEFAFGLPSDVPPGERYDYSNIATFLLSAIIRETTGRETLDYAQEKLFDPMNIEGVKWQRNPEGTTVGYARLWMKPHDMAKFGLLYLQKGRWDGEQLVPESWVEESTTAHSDPSRYWRLLDENGELDRKGSRQNWILVNILRPYADGYGYQFWVDKSGSYTALGAGGQYIMVVPEENLVAAFTSKLPGINSFWPPIIMRKYILKAIKSDAPLEANPAAFADLRSRSGPPAMEAVAVAFDPLPPVAAEISGALYRLEENRWDYDKLRLEFPKGEDYALISYARGWDIPDPIEYRVGLDGVPRVTDTSAGPFAATGGWLDADTFAVDLEWIGYTDIGRFELTFANDEVHIRETGISGEYEYSGRRQ